jgi:tRNA-dihydrouridine synthase
MSGIKKSLPPHKFVVSPMVGGSELAFRMLCRRYGADLCYTPMFESEKFISDPVYREIQFTTCAEDRPLVVQFSGNQPSVLLQAALMVQDQCDAIDLNLGCPQRSARTGHYGAFLTDKADHPLVFEIVSTLNQNLKIPVFCKIRLQDCSEDSLTFARGLENAGCALLCVHGRTRGKVTKRRHGPANMEEIKKIKDGLRIPVVANGNVQTFQHVMDNLAITGCDGVMSAEGILADPSLFEQSLPLSFQQKAVMPAFRRRLALALEYLSLVRVYPCKLSIVTYHIRKLCKMELVRTQVYEDLLDAESIEKVQSSVLLCVNRLESHYKFDSVLHDQQIRDRKRKLRLRLKQEKAREQAYLDLVRRSISKSEEAKQPVNTSPAQKVHKKRTRVEDLPEIYHSGRHCPDVIAGIGLPMGRSTGEESDSETERAEKSALLEEIRVLEAEIAQVDAALALQNQSKAQAYLTNLRPALQNSTLLHAQLALIDEDEECVLCQRSGHRAQNCRTYQYILQEQAFDLD